MLESSAVILHLPPFNQAISTSTLYIYRVGVLMYKGPYIRIYICVYRIF